MLCPWLSWSGVAAAAAQAVAHDVLHRGRPAILPGDVTVDALM
jgi:hypothetical protein